MNRKLPEARYIFYAGTYTEDNGSRGIYKCEVMTEEGSFRILETGDFVENPSYLAFSPDRSMLYAVLETSQYDDEEGGAVASFDISAGGIALRKTALTRGSSPCHVSLDDTGRYLFAANYGDGVLSVFETAASGDMVPAAVFSHKKVAPDKVPHAHYAIMAPDDQYLCVVDLGMDAVVIYAYDKEADHKGKRFFTYFDQCNLASGSGPRHMVFSTDGKMAYVLFELSSEVEVFDYNRGRFTSRQKLSTLPEGFVGESYCAAIRLSPKGDRLYASNRGDDSIAVYYIDGESGLLELTGIYPCGGHLPRDFALLNDEYMLVAHQEPGTVCLMLIDETGALSQVGDVFSIPGAVCVLPCHL